MVGGDPAIVERCRGLFATSAATIIRVGALGSGAAAKIIVQVVTCINMLAAHEAEVLAQKIGLDASALKDVLHQSSGQSFVTDNWLDRFKLADDPMPVRRRRTEVFQKSLTPAVAIARELDLPLSGAELAQRLMPQIMGIAELRQPVKSSTQ
jgi:3-hydroxyisobutyrate dehydrogenase-like beta-hydroxyacid dehydrogenase